MDKPTVDLNRLDDQVSRFGFWCTAACIATGLLAALLPLDVPEGYAATAADRLAWLHANSGAFIAGWTNQIVAMLSLSGFFLALAWRVRHRNPLAALLGAGAVAMATMAFAIPKFMAVWTIPLLTEASITGGAGAEMASVLLPLLNVSIPFSLYTSFDYLGFWLYALFALLVTRPLAGQDGLSKLAALSLGLFGWGFHLALALLLSGVIGAAEIEIYFGASFIPLLPLILVMALIFRRADSD